MYELLTLKVKCPHCLESLMDQSRTIDNEPGIMLDIEISGKRGRIWLSPIYGSYNHFSEIEIPSGQVAKVYCPHCTKQIISKDECPSCGAGMIPFDLDMGGKVSICSRGGCKNHFVEFDDLTQALKKLYDEYSYNSGIQNDAPVKPEVISDKNADENKEILESGTFLQSYCPHCRKSLIENNVLKLKITKGDTGFLMLSPYLNVFSSKSTIYLEEDKVVEDLKCVHCDQSLIIHDKSCGKCNSPIARISVSARTKLIDFFICTKKGCRWHGLSEDDLFEIRLEGSDEW